MTRLSQQAGQAICVACLFASTSLSGFVHAETNWSLAGVRLSVSSDRYSGPLTIDQALADDEKALSPRGSGRDLLYARDEIRLTAPLSLGAVHGELSVLARDSATLVANRDAVVVVGGVQGGAKPQGDAQFAARVRYQAFAGYGLAWRMGNAPGIDLGAKAGRPWQSDGWHWQAGVQALRLTRLVWRRINGTVDYAAASRGYAFDVASDFGDNKQKFSYRKDVPSDGVGALLDAQVERCAGAVCLGAGVSDLGRLRWGSLPRQQAMLSSSTRAYDSNGYLIYKPLVEGRFSQGTAWQSPPPTIDLDARWRPTPEWQVGARADWLQTYGWLPSASVRWEQPATDMAYGAAWNVEQRRLDLLIDSTHWTVGAGADRFGGGSHARQFTVAWHWPLR